MTCCSNDFLFFKRSPRFEVFIIHCIQSTREVFFFFGKAGDQNERESERQTDLHQRKSLHKSQRHFFQLSTFSVSVYWGLDASTWRHDNALPMQTTPFESAEPRTCSFEPNHTSLLIARFRRVLTTIILFWKSGILVIRRALPTMRYRFLYHRP